jgi:hypothetical protein
MAELKGDKPFQDFKLADSARIVESVDPVDSIEPKPCSAMAVVDEGPDVSGEAPRAAPGANTNTNTSSGARQSDSARASLWLAAESRSGSFVAPPYKGLLRHRLIVSSCALLSLSIFALSTVNLRPLIKSAGVINSKLKVDLTPEPPKLSPDLSYDFEGAVRDGMVAVRENKWNSNKAGFVDPTGKPVITPRFAYVRDFSDGFAAFSGEDSASLSGEDRAALAGASVIGTAVAPYLRLEGFIDKAGHVVIKPRFDSAGAFERGVALVCVGDETLLIDKSGKTLFSTASIVRPKKIRIPGEEIDNSYLDEHETMADGQPLIPSSVQSKYLFQGDLAVITTAGQQSGLIDRAGKVVVQPRYDSVIANSVDGIVGYTSVDERTTERNHCRRSAFLVSKDHLWGVLDPAGSELFAPKFKRILSYQNDHAAVMVGDKYGFADARGNIVIKPEYDFVTAFDKIIAVKKGKLWSFIDSTGKLIKAPAVDGVVHSGRGVWLSDGLGQVVKGNKIGFLDVSGQFALEPQFDWAFAFANGYAPVFDGWFWHYIDTSGKRVTPDFVSASSLKDGTSPVVIPGPLCAFVQVGDIEKERQTVKNWLDVVTARAKKNDQPKS